MGGSRLPGETRVVTIFIRYTSKSCTQRRAKVGITPGITREAPPTPPPLRARTSCRSTCSPASTAVHRGPDTQRVEGLEQPPGYRGPLGQERVGPPVQQDQHGHWLLEPASRALEGQLHRYRQAAH